MRVDQHATVERVAVPVGRITAAVIDCEMKRERRQNKKERLKAQRSYLFKVTFHLVTVVVAITLGETRDMSEDVISKTTHTAT